MRYQLHRLAGALKSAALERDPKTGDDVPVERREHEGAGVVTWAIVDGEWQIVGAVKS